MSRSIKTIASMPALIFAILTASPLTLASTPASDLSVDQPTLELARTYFLSDLVKPHRYTPGKNSFLFQTLHEGQKKTLLELTGSGSIRHLWSTWSIPGRD